MLEYNRRADSLSGGVPSELLQAFRVSGWFLLKRVLPVAAILAGVLAGLFLLLRLGDGLAGHDTQPPGAAIARGALSPDGSRVAAIRDDGSVEIRRVSGGSSITQVRGHGAPVIEARFSSDSKQLVTVDAAGGVIVTNMEADGGLREAAHTVSDPGNLHPVVWNDVTRDAWRMGGALERWLSPVSSAARIHNASAVAPVLARGAVPASGTMFRDCEDCPQMVVVPAGKFMMGSPEDEEGRFDDEGPQREVTIAAPFAAGRFEVTVADYARFVEQSGHAAGADCFMAAGDVPDPNWARPGFVQIPDNPVVCVSWLDAQAYVRWLSRETGQTYRLLSEAEWEYSARSGSGGPYPWGAVASHEQANYGAEECCEGLISGRDAWVYTSPVGLFDSNAFGLHDMHGNVWEWVQDCFVEGYASGQPSDGSSFTSGSCEFRGGRGGSWADTPKDFRSANRSGNNPVRRSTYLGFRVARGL